MLEQPQKQLHTTGTITTQPVRQQHATAHETQRPGISNTSECMQEHNDIYLDQTHHADHAGAIAMAHNQPQTWLRTKHNHNIGAKLKERIGCFF